MKELLEGHDVDSVLRESFYRSSGAQKRSARRAKLARPKPDHYEVICISMYREDLSRLDAKVSQLKRSGHRKMNRSALIRFALDTIDVSRLPHSY